MNKIFEGSDVIMQTQVLQCQATGALDPLSVKDWHTRTLFLVKQQIFWYTEKKAEWKSLSCPTVVDVKMYDLSMINDDFVFGLLLTTQQQSFAWGFKNFDDRLHWAIILKTHLTQDPVLISFVNPGISSLHVSLLCKYVMNTEHPSWLKIMQNPHQHQKEIRKSDTAGVTPLHIASYCNLVSEAKVFLQNGSFINVQMDYLKLTPLHFALMGRCFNVFDLLLVMEANPDVPNEQGDTVRILVKREYAWTKYECRLEQSCYIKLEWNVL